MNYRIFIPAVLFFALASCRNSAETVTNSLEYEKYMHITSPDSMHSLQRLNADIEFWKNRIEKNEEDAVAKVSMAGLYSARFKTAGDINDIHTSDSLYLIANPLFKTNSSSLYKSLAVNCVTQHKFKQAKLYLDTAMLMGDDRYITYLMICDVAMELGDLNGARHSLDHIANKNDFDYLIREAKLLDHSGDLDAAIKKMEAATQKAIESKKDALILWSKSNLADMYGHANRYKESYRCYLDLLEKKPDYLYALKGIAWLAFSHDKKTAEAKRILNYLSRLHPVPDYDLLLAKIAAYEKDNTGEEKYLNRFITAVSDTRYGDMYNKYVFYMMMNEKKDRAKALFIAEREVNNRPTSQSYDLLAWAYYNSGRKNEALSLAKSYIENRSYEPEALYHLGVMYADAGNTKKAKFYLKEAEKSAFELGPDLAEQILSGLQSL